MEFPPKKSIFFFFKIRVLKAMRTMEAWLGKVQREAKTLLGHYVKNLCGVWSTGAEELVKSNLCFVGLMDAG